MNDRDIGQLINEETERRLAQMERSDYEFPPRAGLWDAVGIVLAVTISVAMVVCCMLGVIK